MPEELSKETRKVIDHLTVGRSTADVRKECVEQEDYATAFDFLTQFYKEREAINLTGEDAEMEDGAPEEAAEIDGKTSRCVRLTRSTSLRTCQLSKAGCCGLVHGREVHNR